MAALSKSKGGAIAGGAAIAVIAVTRGVAIAITGHGVITGVIITAAAIMTARFSAFISGRIIMTTIIIPPIAIVTGAPMADAAPIGAADAQEIGDTGPIIIMGACAITGADERSFIAAGDRLCGLLRQRGLHCLSIILTILTAWSSAGDLERVEGEIQTGKHEIFVSIAWAIRLLKIERRDHRRMIGLRRLLNHRVSDDLIPQRLIMDFHAPVVRQQGP